MFASVTDGLRLRHRGRRLGRSVVVRVMGVDVEVTQAVALQRQHERERRDRGAAAAGSVVPARVGGTACDGLLDVRRVDARPDRRAHLRVVAGGDGDVLLPHLRVLRPQEDRVIRLIPGHPPAHGGKNGPVRALVRAAVALGRRVGEQAQVAHLLRRPVGLVAAVRPARRAVDREEHLNVVLVRVPHQLVVLVPVVRRVARVGRVCRTLLGDVGAPVQIHADDLHVQLLVGGEGLIRGDERLHGVVDAREHPVGRQRRSGLRGRGDRREGNRHESDARRGAP